MENKNAVSVHEWKDDRERFDNVLNAVAICAASFAVTLLVICFVL